MMKTIITKKVILIPLIILDKQDGANLAAPTDDPDERSIFVKNVHFSTSPEELKNHFIDCGEIKRVTIPVDKMTSKPKG